MGKGIAPQYCTLGTDQNSFFLSDKQEQPLSASVNRIIFYDQNKKSKRIDSEKGTLDLAIGFIKSANRGSTNSECALRATGLDDNNMYINFF